MTTLFQALDDAASARAASLIVEAICLDDYARVRSLLQAVERGEPHVPIVDVRPDVGTFYSASFVFIVLSGTENVAQMVQNVMTATQVPATPLPGSVHA